MTRVIRASRRRVFDAWVRPDFIRQWFAPENLAVTEAEIDLREGGGYRFSIEGTLGSDQTAGDACRRTGVTGQYTRVEPYDVLAFTWRGEWAAGEESLVTIEFRDVEGGTEMKLTHDRFLTEASKAGHERGWTSTLDKLGWFAEATE